jgi:protein-S-isoprenylcysteine O-methyltransferase Ste14
MWLLCVAALWCLFVVVWVVAAFTARKTVKKEPLLSRLRYVLIAASAGVVLQPDVLRVPALDVRWLQGDAWGAVAVLLTAAGIAFAFWARFTLGKNWSGTVTIKKDHELVQTGPYALSRHPIYTGALVALAGSALAVGTLRIALALPFALAAFLFKMRIEERFMSEHFGKAYAEYAGRVKRLVPFVW